MVSRVASVRESRNSFAEMLFPEVVEPCCSGRERGVMAWCPSTTSPRSSACRRPRWYSERVALAAAMVRPPRTICWRSFPGTVTYSSSSPHRCRRVADATRAGHEAIGEGGRQRHACGAAEQGSCAPTPARRRPPAGASRAGTAREEHYVRSPAGPERRVNHDPGGWGRRGMPATFFHFDVAVLRHQGSVLVELRGAAPAGSAMLCV